MPYAEKCKRPLYLLIGFVGMFLCGIGDILFSFRGDGEPTAVSGMMSMNITEVPLYFYFMSFFIGIIAMVGYFFGSRAMYSYCLDRLGKPTKALKAYNFGAVMMSLGIFGIHSVCSMALIALRCAAEAGLSPELINEHFALPMMIPFAVTTTWQTIADLIVGIIYIVFVFKKVIPVSKLWLICGPLVLYVIFNILKVIITAVTGNALIGKLLSGGETWGLAFMFLPVYFCAKKECRSL